MSPAPRGLLRIEARAEAARAPLTSSQPLASSTPESCNSHSADFLLVAAAEAAVQWQPESFLEI